MANHESYVLVNVTLGTILSEHTSERVLKAVATKIRNGTIARYKNVTEVDVMPRVKYELAFPQTKIVRNLMTGKEVEIDVNTPRSCDPSTELYWCM